jgi:RimJ/RimL family protein N-acetyltransferase
MKYILETERLRLRELTLADTPFILALLNSPGWLEFIGDRNVRTEEQAIEYLENGPLKSYQDNGFGLSLVETKDQSQGIGMCGIIRREYLEGPDIGFAFLPEYMGKGYGYEIASATLSYALDTWQLPKVLAIADPTNKKSIRLIEKIGLRLAGTFQLPNKQEELLLFSSEMAGLTTGLSVR